MDEVQSYTSIPDLLKAVLERGAGRTMSIRELSRKLGYSSDRTVGMVVNGQREMGADMLRRLADYAHFSVRDKEYLSLLSLRAKFQKLGKPLEAIELKLKEFRKESGHSRRVDPASLQNMARWYAFTIIKILRFFPKPARAEKIHKFLRGSVALQDLKSTLGHLTELGFIHGGKNGCFRALRDNEYLATPVDMPSTAVRNIHREQLRRAVETLEEQTVSEREFIAKTFLVSAGQIALMKRRLREMLEELADEFVAPDAADAVAVQLNSQLYQQSFSRNGKT